MKQLEAEQSALQQKLTGREKATEQARREGEVRLSELTRQLEEARRAQEELEQYEAQLGSIRTSLSSGDYAAEEQVQLQELESKLEALGYDEDARRQAYSKVQEWQHFAEEARQVDDAESSLPRRKNR